MGATWLGHNRSATLAADEAAVTLEVGGRASVGGAYTTTNFTGNYIFEASCDGGASWTPINFWLLDATPTLQSGVVSILGSSGTSHFYIPLPGGITHVRLRLDAFTSGTLAVEMHAVDTPPGHVFATLMGTDGSTGSSLNLGSVSQYDRVKRAVPTITTTGTAYSENDCIGGKKSLTGLGQPASGDPIQITSIRLLDKQNQKPDLQLLFFRDDPESGTYTDNAAAVVHSVDFDKLSFVQRVVAADWITVHGQTKATVNYSFGDEGPVITPAATTLYMVIIAGATAPDYTATTDDLQVEIHYKLLDN